MHVQTLAGAFEFDRHVLLELTKRCNYFCAHCYTNASPRARGQEPRPSDIDRLRRSLSRLGFPVLTLSGGELMLRRDIEDIVGADPHGLRQWLFTSGIRIDAQRLMRWRSRVDGYSVSLDGNEHMHNELRRSPRSYGDIINFLRLLATHGLSIHLQCMVLRGRLECIPLLVELGEVLGASSILFSHVSPDGRGLDMTSERMTPDDLEALQGRIDELKRSTRLKLYTNLMPRALVEKRFPTPTLHIQPNGTVLPWFAVAQRYALGSLADNDWDLEALLARGTWRANTERMFDRARMLALRYPASVVPVDDVLVDTFREDELCV